jgi:coenzyme PQQ precursor peptide PqqA
MTHIQGDRHMQWNTPDFDEINLSGEVTAYVNTDDDSAVIRPQVSEAATTAHTAARDESA